ncbi:PAS domain-containing sensor histidine kinase [Brevibacillus fulvus]|uniref:histidine kinase n=1 Tax=Brevibacillus fulvus TaxID=1125967 RepID=A0A939BR59_9BACL|nr:ATP-binding protein [Brevibacillus fulvus]MBM7589247.1 PAS domain S-box-containing protein [Brevibacillus fulvus]
MRKKKFILKKLNKPTFPLTPVAYSESGLPEQSPRNPVEILKSQLLFMAQFVTDALYIDLLNGKQIVNKAFEQTFGGDQQAQPSDWREAIADPPSRSEIEAKFQYALTTGQHVQLETSMYDHAGSLLEMQLDFFPIGLELGKVMAMAILFKNVTEHKHLAAVLKESELRYKILAEHSRDIICLVDEHGLISYLSPSVLTEWGFPDEHFIGKHFLEHVHPDDYCYAQAMFRQLFADQKLTRFEVRYAQPQGEWIPFEIKASPIVTAAGAIEKVVCVISNISERKRTEVIMQETEKLSVIGELAAGIAHEIRNPLTSLKGFVQLLRNNMSQYQHYFEIMEAELNRINYIVSELLVLSKPQVLHFKKRNVAEIMDSVIFLLKTQAILKSVEIIAQFPNNLPELECEENQIKQVFINLLKNAIEASPYGGQIFIQASLLGSDAVRIRFIDQGSGIPEEQIARLGEPFYTTKEKGTGLGLMVSNKIVQDHQGSLKISSRLNVGTTVEVILPISPKERRN